MNTPWQSLLATVTEDREKVSPPFEVSMGVKPAWFCCFADHFLHVSPECRNSRNAQIMLEVRGNMPMLLIFKAISMALCFMSETLRKDISLHCHGIRGLRNHAPKTHVPFCRSRFGQLLNTTTCFEFKCIVTMWTLVEIAKDDHVAFASSLSLQNHRGRSHQFVFTFSFQGGATKQIFICPGLPATSPTGGSQSRPAPLLHPPWIWKAYRVRCSSWWRCRSNRDMAPTGCDLHTYDHICIGATTRISRNPPWCSMNWYCVIGMSGTEGTSCYFLERSFH